MSLSPEFIQKLAARGGWDPTVVATILNRWAPWEGTGAKFNPLATTQPGGEDPNDPYWNTFGNGYHVRNYATVDDGVEATYQTLVNGYYPNIEQAFKTGQINWSAMVPEIRKWGTSGLANAIESGQIPPAETVQGGGSLPAIPSANNAVPASFQGPQVGGIGAVVHRASSVARGLQQASVFGGRPTPGAPVGSIQTYDGQRVIAPNDSKVPGPPGGTGSAFGTRPSPGGGSVSVPGTGTPAGPAEAVTAGPSGKSVGDSGTGNWGAKLGLPFSAKDYYTKYARYLELDQRLQRYEAAAQAGTATEADYPLTPDEEVEYDSLERDILGWEKAYGVANDTFQKAKGFADTQFNEEGQRQKDAQKAYGDFLAAPAGLGGNVAVEKKVMTPYSEFFDRAVNMLTDAGPPPIPVSTAAPATAPGLAASAAGDVADRTAGRALGFGSRPTPGPDRGGIHTYAGQRVVTQDNQDQSGGGIGGFVNRTLGGSAFGRYTNPSKPAGLSGSIFKRLF